MPTVKKGDNSTLNFTLFTERKATKWCYSVREWALQFILAQKAGQSYYMCIADTSDTTASCQGSVFHIQLSK